MPQTYLENALHYSAVGNSQMYAASYLRKFLMGYCEEDEKSQLLFSTKSLLIDPSLFFDVVVAMCEGLEKLESQESGYEAVFEKSKYWEYIKTNEE